MTLTLDQQLIIYDRQCDQALEDFIDFLIDNKAVIKEGGRTRLIMGYEQYGTGTWEKSPEEVRREAYYEACDGVCYFAIERHNSGKGPDQ